MNKTTILLLSFCLITSFCKSGNQLGIVNIIIYGDIVPEKNFDSLIYEFTETGLLDSVQVSGWPILIPKLTIEIDTLRAEHLGLNIDEIDKQIKTISYDTLKTTKIDHLYFYSSKGRKIPLNIIADFLLSNQSYKPEIYKPAPSCFWYKRECVVKIELFCKKGNSKKLAKYALRKMQEYASTTFIGNWRFEIIKNEVIKADTTHTIYEK